MVNNRCDKNGVHGQLTLNHSGVCPCVGVGQSPAVGPVLGVGLGQWLGRLPVKQQLVSAWVRSPLADNLPLSLPSCGLRRVIKCVGWTASVALAM